MFWGKLIRNIIFILFPILVIVNFITYTNSISLGNNFEFRGFTYFFNELSTFKSWNNTIDSITWFVKQIRDIGTIAMTGDGWGVVVEILKTIGIMLILPFNLLVTVAKDVVDIIVFVLRIFNVVV